MSGPQKRDRVLLVSSCMIYTYRHNANALRFSAFDEPWKIRYNEEGKEWEDKWGLMDINRNLKKGLTIPDCGGQALPNFD